MQSVVRVSYDSVRGARGGRSGRTFVNPPSEWIVLEAIEFADDIQNYF